MATPRMVSAIKDASIEDVRGFGDLRHDGAVASLLAKAERAIRRRPARLRLDLAGAVAADTRALACIVHIVGLARSAGIEIDVRPSPAIDRWLDLCGLRSLIMGEAVT